MKTIFDAMTAYRLKVERDGKEIVNVPGLLALPGVLLAPKVSIFGTVAASLLGCNIHLENDEGQAVDVSGEVKKVAETVANAAQETAKSIKEEMDRAWDALSADDPEGCPVGQENADTPDGDEAAAEDAGKAPEESETERSAVKEPENVIPMEQKASADQAEKKPEEEIPVIRVNPDDSEKA